MKKLLSSIAILVLLFSFALLNAQQSILQNTLRIQDQIEKLSSSESRIFISGPTGSGKELVARKIHKISQHSVENCGNFNIVVRWVSRLSAKLLVIILRFN